MVLTQGTVTQQEEESDLQINWNGFYRCLMEVGPFAQEVRNLINLIKAGKYTEAFQLAMNLFNSGSQIIKRCFQFIKSSEIKYIEIYDKYYLYALSFGLTDKIEKDYKIKSLCDKTSLNLKYLFYNIEKIDDNLEGEKND